MERGSSFSVTQHKRRRTIIEGAVRATDSGAKRPIRTQSFCLRTPEPVLVKPRRKLRAATPGRTYSRSRQQARSLDRIIKQCAEYQSSSRAQLDPSEQAYSLLRQNLSVVQTAINDCSMELFKTRIAMIRKVRKQTREFTPDAIRLMDDSADAKTVGRRKVWTFSRPVFDNKTEKELFR